ncbi:twin-arginine translocase subunit TatC [Domibacillus mangrovi]|uniref:Sec-independent protein translocase protein TatC n=1 Tax=Domibacillus mangrovi TaxID=1714354 RepID=A0A1Q5P334_9BACI|nr:twin-arginine translocase subunit TatC [Domibacillus mangrovi]OKL36654.1 twin arginine-targeting protein translocase TatC [Domibacillus mangrovi]
MDPYGEHNKKVLSPLDKVSTEEAEASQVEESVITDRTEEPAELGTSLVEHLTDLRRQLIKSTVVFLFFFIIVFSSINFWFPYVTRGHELIILGPLEVIKFYMSISLALSLGLSLPFVSHFLWQFVKPGLNEKESRFIGFYSPAMLLLFIAGVAFGYFVVNPLSYQFLISMGSLNFNVMVSAQEYIRFLLMSTVPLGLLFEMPIVALFLAAIGILTAETMRIVRKWSYLIIVVLSAVITPPDFISQLLVLIPMALLYEASIYIVTFIERRQAKLEHIHVLNGTNE